MAGYALYGGDQVSALVVDIGGSQLRAGYAGEDAPRAAFPSAAGALLSEGDGGGSSGSGGGSGGGGKRRELLVGGSALTLKRPGMEVVNAIGADGLVADWDVANAMVSYALSERLGADPRDNVLLVAEPTHAPRRAREAAVEALFEAHAPPALCLARAAALAALAVGRQSALVVDAGYRATTAAAVHEGQVVLKSVTRTPLAGALLTAATRALLEKELAPRGARLMARHQFRRVPIPDFAQYETVVEPNDGVTPSYDAWGLARAADEAKEALLRAPDAAFDEASAASMPYAAYELPDGTEVNVGPDRFRAAELLFQPARLSAFPGLEADPSVAGGARLYAWPGLVRAAIDACDADMRPDMWSSVVLTGGTSLLPNSRERLERELGPLAPTGGGKPRVNAPVAPAEKRFAAWIGGSILASLPSFGACWLSAAEYDEHGAGLIHRKMP